MAVQQLRVRGFRSLRDVAWEPGRLNVVIGPNGSGKSNLLRALALLRDAATGELSDVVTAQGGIAPLLWDGQVSGLEWAVKAILPGRDAQRDALTYELTLRRLGETSTFRVEHELLGNYF